MHEYPHERAKLVSDLPKTQTHTQTSTKFKEKDLKNIMRWWKKYKFLRKYSITSIKVEEKEGKEKVRPIIDNISPSSQVFEINLYNFCFLLSLIWAFSVLNFV